MKKHWNIITNDEHAEIIAGPFSTVSLAEMWAHDNNDPYCKGHTVADGIAGGEYKIVGVV